MAAKGRSTVLSSSEEQNKIRRAKKQSKNGKQRTRKGTSTETYFDGLLQDRREKRQRQQAAAEKRRDAKSRPHSNRIQQALTAHDFPPYRAMSTTSLAYKVATGILHHFPTVNPVPNQKRTLAAFEMTRKGLTPDEQQLHLALERGLSIAAQALRYAYDQLDSQRETEVSQQRDQKMEIPQQRSA